MEEQIENLKSENKELSDKIRALEGEISDIQSDMEEIYNIVKKY